MLSNLLTLGTLLTLTISPPPPQPVPVFQPICWTTEASTLYPAVFAECRAIARRISNSPLFEPDIPLKFSVDPSTKPDIQLPAMWGRDERNCGVGIQANPPSMTSGYDTTTLRQVAEAALLVARECVIKPPHLGGLTMVGWKDKLAVNVLNLGRPHEINDNRTLSTA
ncbi:MAG: hypothetical protein Q9224_006918 [Gallowayella concinna]